MTILNTEVIKEPNEFLIVCFLICMVVCVVILFVFAAFGNLGMCGASTAVIVLFAILALISNFVTNGYKEYNRYEVILDEKYSANELYEKYDVIGQRGEIWVIEDKEKKISVK